MNARLKKLGFVVLLFTWLAVSGPTLGAVPPAQDGWCYCYDPRSPVWYNYYVWAYIYDYPWQFINQSGRRSSPFPGIMEWPFNFHGADQFCFQHCLYSVALPMADGLCDAYGNANHHIQVQFYWHWEDTDGDFYNVGAGYDTGSQIVWCQ
jgi:hypothetical protein